MSVASSSRVQLDTPIPTTGEIKSDITIPKRRKLPWRRYVTPTETLLSYEYRGQGTEADPYIVEWLPDDQEYPMNWKSVSRVTIYTQALSILTSCSLINGATS